MGESPTRRNAPAGSNRSNCGGNETVEAFGEAVTKYGGSARVQAVTRVNAEQASKRTMRRLTRISNRGRLIRLGKRADEAPSRRAGVVATACTQGKRTQHGKPRGVLSDEQPDACEGWTGRPGVTERPVLPLKPGNAGGGKGPQFRTDARRSEGQEIGQPINSEKRSEAAECVTRESEDRTRLSVLRPVRQDLPGRHPVRSQGQRDALRRAKHFGRPQKPSGRQSERPAPSSTTV